MMSLSTILAIGSGGFIGAVLRAYINGLLPRTVAEVPIGTLSVNLLGSFMLGALFALFAVTTIFNVHTRSFLSTGMMGALTTYSTFAYESFLLIQGGSFGYAILNMSLNLFGTILFAGIGYKLVNVFY